MASADDAWPENPTAAAKVDVGPPIVVLAIRLTARLVAELALPLKLEVEALSLMFAELGVGDGTIATVWFVATALREDVGDDVAKVSELAVLDVGAFTADEFPGAQVKALARPRTPGEGDSCHTPYTSIYSSHFMTPIAENSPLLSLYLYPHAGCALVMETFLTVMENGLEHKFAGMANTMLVRVFIHVRRTALEVNHTASPLNGAFTVAVDAGSPVTSLSIRTRETRFPYNHDSPATELESHRGLWIVLAVHSLAQESAMSVESTRKSQSD